MLIINSGGQFQTYFTKNRYVTRLCVCVCLRENVRACVRDLPHLGASSGSSQRRGLNPDMRVTECTE
jgi:hypothetical protein